MFFHFVSALIVSPVVVLILEDDRDIVLVRLCSSLGGSPATRTWLEAKGAAETCDSLLLLHDHF